MNDEELRQAMQTLEAYNQQLENINRQARLLQNTRDDAVRATRTVQALIDAKPGDEILIPVGGSCLVTVQVSEKKKAIIGIGSKVKILDIEFDEEMDFTITGSTEANSLKGKISNESPVGRALLGHKEGDTVKVETQAGELKYKIISVA